MHGGALAAAKRPADLSSSPAAGDYESLADFRYELRGFFAFSAETIEAAGLAPAQYQAMLAIKAHRGPDPITVSALADRLFTRVNSTVGLVQRLEAAGLVERRRADADRRRIELRLTDRGDALTARLAALHLAEHRQRLPALARLIAAMLER